MRQVNHHQEVFITARVGWVTDHVSVTNNLDADTLYLTEQAAQRQFHVRVLEITVGVVETVLYVLNTSKAKSKNITINTVSGEIKWHK
jgi:hypothetical protein